MDGGLDGQIEGTVTLLPGPVFLRPKDLTHTRYTHVILKVTSDVAFRGRIGKKQRGVKGRRKKTLELSWPSGSSVTASHNCGTNRQTTRMIKVLFDTRVLLSPYKHPAVTTAPRLVIISISVFDHAESGSPNVKRGGVCQTRFFGNDFPARSDM